MGSYAGIYYIVAEDSGADKYLVVQVLVDGPALVASRWDKRADAERDAERWTELAAAVSA